jgi:hypothetical protein
MGVSLAANFKSAEHVVTDSNDNQLQLSYQLFLGREGISIGLKLANKLKSCLKNSGISIKSLKDFQNANIDIGLLIGNLIEGISNDDTYDLIFTLLKNCNIDGKSLSDKTSIDIVFQGEYGLLIQCLTNVIKDNFKSVFSLGGIGAQLGLKKKSHVENNSY